MIRLEIACLIFFSFNALLEEYFLSGYVNFLCFFYLLLLRGVIFSNRQIESFVLNFDLIISPTKIFVLICIHWKYLDYLIKLKEWHLLLKVNTNISFNDALLFVFFLNNVNVCLILWITRAFCGQKFNMHSIRHFGSYDSVSYHYKYLKEWCNSNKMIRFCTIYMLKM